MTPFRSLPAPRLTRFDRVVVLILLALLAAIALTIALGDHVGVRVLRAAPQGQAHSTAWIILQFSEEMDRDTVAQRLRVEPAVEGDLSWSSATLALRPRQALQPDRNYHVVLEPGAQSVTGRKVLREHRFTFSVRQPQVAFLAPADGVPQNIWIVDPADPAAARQVTFTTSDIFNYDVSPDGARIAFAEHNSETNTFDIKVLDLSTGSVQRLTDCVDSDCTTPAWRPDGRMIAYERVDHNTALGNVGVSPTRVWLLDLTTDPPANRPLFADSQILGYGPEWSPDGRLLAVFDNSSQAILVYDFEQDEVMSIPSNHGTVGAFSPDGQQLVYPQVVLMEGGARSHLAIASLETRRLTSLTPPEEPVDDQRAAWSPDGRFLALGRRYLDDRYTSGRPVYLLDTETGEVALLLDGQRYYNGYFEWAPAGQQLVVQRFPQPPEDGPPPADPPRPEIWVVDVADGSQTRVATNAFWPRWVP